MAAMRKEELGLTAFGKIGWGEIIDWIFIEKDGIFWLLFGWGIIRF